MSIYSLQIVATRRANVQESSRSFTHIESFINMNFFEIVRVAFSFLHLFNMMDSLLLLMKMASNHLKLSTYKDITHLNDY